MPTGLHSQKHKASAYEKQSGRRSSITVDLGQGPKPTKWFRFKQTMTSFHEIILLISKKKDKHIRYHFDFDDNTYTQVHMHTGTENMLT